MVESEFNDPRRYRGREIHDRAHDLEHAIKRMEHDMRHGESERIHAIRDAMKNNMACAGHPVASGPRTVDEVLVEIDSYLSYLEDLPAERLATYENKIDSLAGHLEKLRSSLKSKIQDK